jgi:membrane-associated phospholipid phosphatase
MRDPEAVVEHLRTSVRAAALPVAGLFLTYLLAVVSPWGRTLDRLSSYGRNGTGWSVRAADLMVLETISVATLSVALAALVVVGGLRGRWQLGLRSTAAVIGAILSVEALKHLLPSHNQWTGEWSLISGGSFPSGHAVIVTSISLAVLSISSDSWRRRLVGPLVACTAIATTATVTVGWHRPSDVLGSLFLATAWHRAMRADQPAERRLRTMLPRPALPRTALPRTALPRTALPRTALPRTALPRPALPRTALSRLQDRLPTTRTAAWWAGACTLILGAALEGAVNGLRYGSVATLAYLCSLAVLLAAVLVTVAMGLRPVPAHSRP